VSATFIEVGGRRWRFLPEAGPRPADRAQAIVSGQLRDELTGLPPSAPIAVSTHSIGVVAKATAGARIGLVGRPAALYPDPWPAPPPSANLRAESDIHLLVELDTGLGVQPAMPTDFALVDLGTIDLRRAPTLLSGRVVSRSTGPAAGAAVTVSAFWPTFAAITGPGSVPDALSIWAGLYADRPVGAVVRRRTLTLQPAPKRLLLPAAAGGTVLRLSDRQGLIVGRPVAIEPGDPERQEYVAVAAVDAASSPDQPALVTLAHPLRRAHPEGVTVARTTFAAAGPDNHLVRDGRRGDVSLFTDGLAGITAANRTIEISGGAGPEYHGFALWRTTTASDGAFRLPPIHRVAAVELTGPAGADPVRIGLVAPGEAVADILFD
jgi:hypothetical protein